MNNEKNCCSACSCLGIIISILFGAVIGILFALGFAPFVVTSIYIAFGLAALSLVILVAAIFISNTQKCSDLAKCVCKNGNCLLVGSIGSIFFAMISLSIVLDIAFVPVAILVAIEAFFFAFMLISLICFISCVIDSMCSS